MSLGHKDVVQNVAKVDHAAHQWLDYQEGLQMLQGNSCYFCSDDSRISSPTLFDLLNVEIELGIHPSLP